jgi:hypothetical protein
MQLECRPVPIDLMPPPARSLGLAQHDHAVVTACGACTVAHRLAVARATRRGMEAGASMRGKRKSRRAMPRRRELTE